MIFFLKQTCHSQTGGRGGGPPLGKNSHIFPFFFGGSVPNGDDGFLMVFPNLGYNGRWWFWSWIKGKLLFFRLLEFPESVQVILTDLGGIDILFKTSPTKSSHHCTSCIWRAYFWYHRKVLRVFRSTITIKWNCWRQPLGTMVVGSGKHW